MNMEVRFTGRELWVKCLDCYHADPRRAGILPDGNYVFRWKVKPGKSLDALELMQALDKHMHEVHAPSLSVR